MPSTRRRQSDVGKTFERFLTHVLRIKKKFDTQVSHIITVMNIEPRPSGMSRCVARAKPLGMRGRLISTKDFNYIKTLVPSRKSCERGVGGGKGALRQVDLVYVDFVPNILQSIHLRFTE